MLTREEILKAAQEVARLNPEWILYRVAGDTTDWLRLSHKSGEADITKGWGFKTWIAYGPKGMLDSYFRSPVRAIRALGFEIRGAP